MKSGHLAKSTRGSHAPYRTRGNRRHVLRGWASAGSVVVLGLVALVPAARGQGAAPVPENSPSRSGAGTMQLDVPLQMLQPSASQSGAPVTITLQDALERARKNDPLYLSAISDAKSAHEDRVQARAALLPNVSASTQFLGTQGNGVTPNGRYVTNDGVHVYRAWGVFRQDLSPGTFMATAVHRAAAAEALANAKTEIARRGLTGTVTKNFYAFLVAQRKYATAQQALEQSKQFFDLTANSEAAGQSPHSDAIKAEIQYRLQQQSYDDTRLGMETARLNLAVILFPVLNENFSVVDDLDTAQALPPFDEIRAMAEKENPDLRVATQTVRQAEFDVTAAKVAFLPTLSIDTDYGIEGNSFALKSVDAVCAGPREVGVVSCQGVPLPKLGYFVTAVLNIPVWDWGVMRSKLRQSQYRRDQARVQLSQAQRQLVSNLYGFYNEAAIARASVEGARRTAELATESLRLVNLRYQAGASTALEVVDAENTLTLARNSYVDAQARSRNAVANLQTLTGTF